MEMANITYQDEAGNIKVKISQDKCINCGMCVWVCKHDARRFTDDTGRFFDDLAKGIPISLIAAPSVKTNVPEYKKLFTYLKSLGVNKIYDVSLGADICIWAHVNYLKKTGTNPIITQPCPPIVTYCEIYQHGLLENLSPVHSPMACTSIYMKNYQGINDRIAALSPCVSKTIEFQGTKLAQYNVTFTRLLEYLDENKIKMPDEETDFDHAESGLGSLFPMPGGFKENIEYMMGKNLHIAKAEGRKVYEKLNKYAKTPAEFLPDIYDVLNCEEGCNIGSASLRDDCIFKIEKTMKNSARKMIEEQKKKHYSSMFKSYDDTFELTHFLRKYNPISTQIPQLTKSDIDKAFGLLEKDNYEKQHIDCYACGSKTCYDMARRIALNVNIPESCIIKTKDDAKNEHEENLLAHEQLAAIEKSREADELVRILLDATPLAAQIWDKSFNIIDCNKAALTLFNIASKQEFLDLSKLLDFSAEVQLDGRLSKDAVDYYLHKAFAEGYQRFEWMYCLSDGELMPCDIILSRIDYKGEHFVAAFIRDLREQKRMMAELEAYNEKNELQLMKLNMVIKSTKIGLWDMDIDKDNLLNPENSAASSDEFKQMLGFTDQNDFPHVLGSWSSRLHPDDQEAAVKAFYDHLTDKTGKTEFDVEHRLLKKNGEYGYYRGTGETLRDKDGNPIRIAGSLIDMTEVKTLIHDAEEQRVIAENANQAKSEFMSHISHEIRTPMNAILGTAEIQLQKENISPEMEEAFDTIYNSGNLLLNIINDILDLSKIEAGKLSLFPVNYDIPSIIYDTVQLNLLRYESKPIVFDLKIDKNTPHDLFGDELRLKQIMNNILSNAFKYTEEGRVELSVSAEVDEDLPVVQVGPDMPSDCILVLRITDTGQGMTEEQVVKLFEEYTRFNMDTNRTIVGTGLGMHITKRLVDAMEGRIMVESVPGKGSAFTVRIPQKRTSTELCGEELAERLLDSRFKKSLKLNRVQIVHEYMPYGSVLIVDDVESNLYVAKGMMAPYGLKIETVSSGIEAVRRIKNGSIYDIIFMDHMMPLMNGIEATKLIRGMGYKNPIVALTANAVVGSSEMFLASNFDEYISKPIDIRELNSCLNRLIRDRQSPEVIAVVRRERELQIKISASKSMQNILVNDKMAAAVVRDIENAISVLNDLLAKKTNLREPDIDLFTITVHGMKSALHNIGENQLSGTAYKLEQTGKNKDINKLLSETPIFIKSLQTLTEKIKPKTAADNASGSNEISKDDILFLQEKLVAIKTAVSKLKKSEAKIVLDEIMKKTWPNDINELLDEISEHLLLGQFKMIAVTVDKAHDILRRKP